MRYLYLIILTCLYTPITTAQTFAPICFEIDEIHPTVQFPTAAKKTTRACLEELIIQDNGNNETLIISNGIITRDHIADRTFQNEIIVPTRLLSIGASIPLYQLSESDYTHGGKTRWRGKTVMNLTSGNSGVNISVYAGFRVTDSPGSTTYYRISYKQAP